jgi:hypothetical protein
MAKKSYAERALAAYFRQMAQQKRVAIPLTDLPIQTLEETVAEKDYVMVCNGFRALAVYRVKSDGLRRLKRWPKELDLRL